MYRDAHESTMTNIQDLLVEEYKDFADVILIESPFILVTPQQKGVKWVKAAFTPDKLIIAVSSPQTMSDDVKTSDDVQEDDVQEDDIQEDDVQEEEEENHEDLELSKLIPLPFLEVSVLDKKNHRLQVRLLNNELIYLEFRDSNAMWKEWEAKINQLNGTTQDNTSPFKIDPALTSIAKDSVSQEESAEIPEKTKKKKKREKNKAACSQSKKKSRRKSKESKRVQIVESEDDINLYLPPETDASMESSEPLSPQSLNSAEIEAIFQESLELSKNGGTSPLRHGAAAAPLESRTKPGGPRLVTSMTSTTSEELGLVTPVKHKSKENSPAKGISTPVKTTPKMRWRKLAIQTRFAFHRPRKITFGVQDILRKAYSPTLENVDNPLQRSASLTNLKTRCSVPEYGLPDTYIRRSEQSLGPFLSRSASLPQVFEGEASFLDERNSSQFKTQDENKVEESVSFVRYRKYASVDQGKFRRPSFLPPQETNHDILSNSSSLDSIDEIFNEAIKRQSISQEPCDSEPVPTKKKKRRLSLFKGGLTKKLATLSSTGSIEKLFTKKKGKHSVPLPTPVFINHVDEKEDLGDYHSSDEDGSVHSHVSFEMCSPVGTRGNKYDEKTLRKNMIFYVLSLDSMNVAKELTMIIKKLFFNIPSSELTDCLWTKKDKYKRAPNIMTMIDFFERTANLVATHVLIGETAQERAKLIRKFISIAEKSNQLQNFNSLRSLLGGLQLTPIYRLDQTWSCVMSKYPKKFKSFQDMSEMMGHEENFAKYRTALEKAMENPPCVPFIGVFLQTVLALDTAKDVTGLKKRRKAGSRKLSQSAQKSNARRGDLKSGQAAEDGSSVTLGPNPGIGSPSMSKRSSILIQAKEKIQKILHVAHHHSSEVVEDEQYSDLDALEQSWPASRESFGAAETPSPSSSRRQSVLEQAKEKVQRIFHAKRTQEVTSPIEDEEDESDRNSNPEVYEKYKAASSTCGHTPNGSMSLETPSPSSSRRQSVLELAKEKVQRIFHVRRSHEATDLAEEDEGNESDHNNNHHDGGESSPSRPTAAESEVKRSSGQRHRKLTLFELSDDELSDDDAKKPAFMQMKPKDMLFHYQIAALPYNYPSVSSIRDFLLHADYLPDDENYKISLKREPKN